jgi:hypothetical protein
MRLHENEKIKLLFLFTGFQQKKVIKPSNNNMI